MTLPRRSLRFRLLAISTGLTLAGMVVVNVVAWVALSSTLLDRVDSELMTVPTGPGGGARPQLPPAEPAAGGASLFLSNHVIVRLNAVTGEVVSAIRGPQLAGAPAPDLTGIQAEIRSGTPFSDTLVTLSAEGDPSYHYRARVLNWSDEEVLVVGVSLSNVEATIAKVRTADAVISVLVVAALIGVGMPSLRVGLRPLTEVETAAERIASGETATRAPHASEQTEVGSLARTFNLMVDKMVAAVESASDSEERLRRFLADASHELRTPLTSIRAYAELFDQGALSADPAAKEAMARIQAEAGRMGVLVDDLLLLARLDQTPQLVAEPLLFDVLVHDVATDVATAAPTHLVQVTTPGFPVVMYGDELALRQVVRNLVRNAVVHTPAGTQVHIEVSCTDDTVTLTVRDDGPGMASDVSEHIFERFYRPDTGRSRSVAGTGLGLAIVESIVGAHQGEIVVTTAPGAGASFSIDLPRTPPD
jgi:two-component system, OmpR family, sensor kinase